jgi:maltose O-acetyltransferase
MEGKEKVYYERGTDELRMKNIRAHKLEQEFNNCPIEDSKRKEEIIQELFGSVGVNLSIEHNFHCDLGYNIHVEDNLYTGYNCTILDMTEVAMLQ